MPQSPALLELVAVMARLRAECGWKAEQTHTSLSRYLLEETYEVLEAIDSGDPDHLREELGDLLLQVLFHAAIAAEAGEYDIEDVARGLLDKLIRRNPHVFGSEQESDPERINEVWQQIKASEKQRDGLLDGIPLELPALARADKVLERLTRAEAATDPGPASTVEEQIGSDLLAVVTRAREAGVDPERALRAAVRRISP